MRTALTFGCLALALLAACGDSPRESAPEPVRSRYQAGQVWTYETRPGEEGSRVRVVKVENHARLGVMVHVQVDGLEIPNPASQEEQDAFIRVVAHMPMSEAAMDASVRERVAENQPIPHYEEGYRAWKRAFLAGEAGIFEDTIATKLDHYAAAVAAGPSPAGDDP